MFASGDPLCREESTPNPGACQADFENNLINAANEAEDAGIHTYLVVLRDSPAEAPILDTMATGDGVVFYTTDLEDVPFILDDLNGTVPVSLVR